MLTLRVLLFMDIRSLTPQPGRLKCVWVPGADGRVESIWVPDWEHDVEVDEPVRKAGERREPVSGWRTGRGWRRSPASPCCG